MRFTVQDITNVAAYTEQADELHRALCVLADDLNASLLHYEVTLEHFDTGDFLRFEMRSEKEIEDIKGVEEAIEAMT